MFILNRGNQVDGPCPPWRVSSGGNLWNKLKLIPALCMQSEDLRLYKTLLFIAETKSKKVDKKAEPH